MRKYQSVKARVVAAVKEMAAEFNALDSLNTRWEAAEAAWHGEKSTAEGRAALRKFRNSGQPQNLDSFYDWVTA